MKTHSNAPRQKFHRDKPSLIKLVHVAKREIKMEDEIYRDVLTRTTGKNSCKDMNIAELEAVLAAMKGYGFKPQATVASAAKNNTRLNRAVSLGELAANAAKRKSAAGNDKNRQARPLADDPQSRKIRSLWLELRDLGGLRDASETALAHWVKNQTGIEALQWLSTAQASKCIDALKSWRDRVKSQLIAAKGEIDD